jgi:hypothetical protein
MSASRPVEDRAFTLIRETGHQLLRQAPQTPTQRQMAGGMVAFMHEVSPVSVGDLVIMVQFNSRSPSLGRESRITWEIMFAYDIAEYEVVGVMVGRLGYIKLANPAIISSDPNTEWEPTLEISTQTAAAPCLLGYAGDANPMSEPEQRDYSRQESSPRGKKRSRDRNPDDSPSGSDSSPEPLPRRKKDKQPRKSNPTIGMMTMA